MVIADDGRLWVLQVRMPGKDPWLVGVYSGPESLLAAAEAYRRLEEGQTTGDAQAWFWKCLEAVEADLDRPPAGVAEGAFGENARGSARRRVFDRDGDMNPDDGFRLDDLVDRMADSGAHPSYFTLSAFATGSPKMPVVGDHMAHCLVCRAVVEDLAFRGRLGRSSAALVEKSLKG